MDNDCPALKRASAQRDLNYKFSIYIIMNNFNKLLVTVMMMVMAFSASAETFSIGNLKYETIAYDRVGVIGLSESGVAATNLALEIPGTVTYNGTTYRVYSVRANSLQFRDNIKSVRIRFGVDIIEAAAFWRCTSLETLYLPSSLSQIVDGALYLCNSLKTVYYAGFNFPKLGVYFPSNSGMTLYISPLSKRSIAEYKAADGWKEFTNVVKSSAASDILMADGGYYSIGYSDQWGPTTFRSATLVGYYPFGDGTNDGAMYKPTGPAYAPANIIPFTIDTIGPNIFNSQPTIKTIDLSNATSLKYINTIGPSTGVTNVTKLVLPPSNFSFNTNTFDNLTGVSAFELASGSTSFSIYDGCLYNNYQNYLYRVPRGKTGSMYYPSTLLWLWIGCHENCTNITDAYLPYGVDIIKDNAFFGCSNLKYIKIPSSVTSLSTSNVFTGINSNAYVYINMPNPPTITVSEYFGTNSSIDLAVPYGKEQTYKNAGWTGFYGYNRSGVGQAYDELIGSLSPACTVTSTASFTAIDGTTYAGRVKTVAHGSAVIGGSATSVEVPNYVTINGKKYAVTMIGEKSFTYKSTSPNYTVTGCVNVDTVGAYAFQNQPITSYPFGHNSSRYIMGYAFDGAGFTGTLALPYGIKFRGGHSFGNGKYSRLVVPNSLATLYGSFCYNTSTLTELVINKNGSNYYNYTGWDLGTVPSTCYIRVPTGVVKQYQQNSVLSSRADHITAGAYDFAWNNNFGNYYFLTITSTASTTYNGTTYAGKAKYVYHPNIQNYSGTNNFGFSTSEEDRTVSGDYRNYLITELGDSLLYGSGFVGGTIPPAVTRIGQSAFCGSAYAVNNLTLPSGLTFIGHDAFYASKITGELKIPASVTQIESYALNTSTLSSIYFPSIMPTMGSYVWNASFNGTVWVPNNYASSYLTTANGWSESYGNKLGVWFKPYASSVPFSSVLPTNLAGSNIYAYIATAYDKSNPTQQLTMTKVDQAAANTGMIMTGLTANQEYRIKQPTSTVSAPATNYLVGTPRSTVRVDQETVGYYWGGSASKPHFIKPTSAYSSNIGQAYLKLSSTQASGIDEVYTNLWPKPTAQRGDINGDNSVDVADINIIINIMLGLDSASNYIGDANVDGEGGIDVSDVNVLINIILGKE